MLHRRPHLRPMRGPRPFFRPRRLFAPRWHFGRLGCMAPLLVLFLFFLLLAIIR